MKLNDDSLEDLVTSETLEELEINKSFFVNGCFLTSLRTNLKSLAMNECLGFLITFVHSAVSYLSGLTRLELDCNSMEILKKVHLLLDKMPNLEHLSLKCYGTVVLSDELPASIGRLVRLRELHLWQNDNVTDEWLLVVARGCPALRIVDVGLCPEVTGRGVVALCRARPELTELVVQGLAVTDADLEACARCCAGLRRVDAVLCKELTQNLPARLAWPRVHPLQLRLWREHFRNLEQVIKF